MFWANLTHFSLEGPHNVLGQKVVDTERAWRAAGVKVILPPPCIYH